MKITVTVDSKYREETLKVVAQLLGEKSEVIEVTINNVARLKIEECNELQSVEMSEEGY